MKTTEQPSIECSLSDAGDLIVSRSGKVLATVERTGLTDENRKALAAFVKSCSELRSIDEWEPGEVVIATRGCAIRDPYGLPLTVLRGQRIDERSLIEQILAIKDPEPVRVLRAGAELEVESVQREALDRRLAQGQAQNVLVQKRTILAMSQEG